jgi:hypothetical protein
LTPRKQTAQFSAPQLRKDDHENSDCNEKADLLDWNNFHGLDSRVGSDRSRQAVDKPCGLVDDDGLDLPTCGQDKKKTCKGDCWKMDSPIKSSKNQWLIRLRSCRACGRKVKPITYKTDTEIENLRKDAEKYEQFKRDVEAATKNQKNAW